MQPLQLELLLFVLSFHLFTTCLKIISCFPLSAIHHLSASNINDKRVDSTTKLSIFSRTQHSKYVFKPDCKMGRTVNVYACKMEWIFPWDHVKFENNFINHVKSKNAKWIECKKLILCCKCNREVESNWYLMPKKLRVSLLNGCQYIYENKGGQSSIHRETVRIVHHVCVNPYELEECEKKLLGGRDRN